MNALIMDKDFKSVAIIDDYESFIWTDRYVGYGDFELYAPVSAAFFEHTKDGYYIWNDSSEHLMIIEKNNIESDAEDGSHVTVKGRSLESILDRRIIWKQTTITGNLQNGIKKLLDENVISPSDTKRKIPNFVFKASADEVITKLTVDAQYTGDNLYDVIKALCETNELGFKVILNSDLKFEFSLYFGTDRSYSQKKLPYVIFSPNFENLVNSNYYESSAELKNVALVGGEGEGSDRKFKSICGNGVTEYPSGMDRRELFVDARDLSTKTSDKTLSTAEYNAQLEQRGYDKLGENIALVGFEGNIENIDTVQYGKDFFVGDIIQIQNEYMIRATARVDEIVMSDSVIGNSIVPTFSTPTLTKT
nr:MAG TPA: hypothetical protein [Caudoviricetes sp.]